jgi:hypothetical protein
MMPLKPITWKATLTLRKVTFADENKTSLYVKYHMPEYIENASEVMIGEKLKTYTVFGTSEQVLSEITGYVQVAEACECFIIVEKMERVEA